MKLATIVNAWLVACGLVLVALLLGDALGFWLVVVYRMPL